MWTPAASRACFTVIPKRTSPMPFRCTSWTVGTMPGAWAAAGATSATAATANSAALVALSKAAQRDRVPEEQEGSARRGRYHGRCRARVEEVGDEHHRASHRDRQQEQPEDHDAVAGLDDPPLVLLAELEPVVRGGGDQADCGRRRAEQGGEEHRLLELRHVGETLVERHDQQEREQHLHPRQSDAQLPQHLLEVAVEPLRLGLLATGLGMTLLLVCHRRDATACSRSASRYERGPNASASRHERGSNASSTPTATGSNP